MPATSALPCGAPTAVANVWAAILSAVVKPSQKSLLVAPSVRKVPQLYSRAASYIATQLYLGYAQVIFASRVLKANIISLKRQVSISLFRNISPLARCSKEYHCETSLTISLNILIFEIG